MSEAKKIRAFVAKKYMSEAKKNFAFLASLSRRKIGINCEQQ